MWKCKKCGEEIEDQFDSCWKCDHTVEAIQLTSTVRKQQPKVYQRMEATVIDIKMPFWSMVVFLVKLSIAAIPAAIIVVVIYLSATALIGGLFAGLMGNGSY